LLCAEIGAAIYRYFNSTDGAEPAPVARVLTIGSDGELVVALQRTLNERLKPSPNIGTDGDFGPETEGAVKKFQSQVKLEPTGVVDAPTWRALGPLVMEEKPGPEPSIVNAELTEKLPMDELTGPPFVTAKAWVIVDAMTGKVLAGENESQQRDPASTTKMMTAYVVTSLAENDPQVLDEIATFSARADKTTGSTSDVREGERLSVGELLYGLLLPSGNDAAVALAQHLGGRFAEKKEGVDGEPDPYDSFIVEMNRRAHELGMASTHFNNPHGLPSEGHQTTPCDLAKLAAAALRQPEFAKRVAAVQHGTTIDSISGYQRNVVWRNTNQLLRHHGYLGVKTGTTGAAGCCLVSCGERDGKRLIVVVLGSTSTEARYADTRNLYRWAWTNLVRPAGDSAADAGD
jgi:D-alanyl-D-alanine carboxypeptidase (penicillin-binding protein 5/6)